MTTESHTVKMLRPIAKVWSESRRAQKHKGLGPRQAHAPSHKRSHHFPQMTFEPASDHVEKNIVNSIPLVGEFNGPEKVMLLTEAKGHSQTQENEQQNHEHYHEPSMLRFWFKYFSKCNQVNMKSS